MCFRCKVKGFISCEKNSYYVCLVLDWNGVLVFLTRLVPVLLVILGLLTGLPSPADPWRQFEDQAPTDLQRSRVTAWIRCTRLTADGPSKYRWTGSILPPWQRQVIIDWRRSRNAAAVVTLCLPLPGNSTAYRGDALRQDPIESSHAGSEISIVGEIN